MSEGLVMSSTAAAAQPSLESPCLVDGALIIRSPFPINVQHFDDENDYPDIFLVFPGRTSPVFLHRAHLRVSQTLDDIFNNRPSARGTYNQTTRVMDSVFVGMGEAQRQMFLGWLGFCYGREMVIEPRFAPAALSVLVHLQLVHGEWAQRHLERFMIDAATRDPEMGALMLVEYSTYKECHCHELCSVGSELARCVLSRENIETHYEAVVDKCLQHLPYSYLDMAEYGEPHTEHSEFSVRVRYVHFNDSTSPAEKSYVMKQCRPEEFGSAEMATLCSFPFMSKDDLLAIYQKVLVSMESRQVESDVQRDAHSDVGVNQDDPDEAHDSGDCSGGQQILGRCGIQFLDDSELRNVENHVKIVFVGHSAVAVKNSLFHRDAVDPSSAPSSSSAQYCFEQGITIDGTALKLYLWGECFSSLFFFPLSKLTKCVGCMFHRCHSARRVCGANVGFFRVCRNRGGWL